MNIEFPTLPPEMLTAIVGGYHRDPFAVLGPHTYEDGVIVRTFMPDASSVKVSVPGWDTPLEMIAVHRQGLFEAYLPHCDLNTDYHYLVTNRRGEVVRQDDPYRYPVMLSDYDRHLLSEGTHVRMYNQLGAHLREVNGRYGVLFTVWAPSAQLVSVIGDFNAWDRRRHPMRFHPGNGIWELFIPGLGEGTIYKYEIQTRYHGLVVAKSDPVGFYSELRPRTASVVWDIDKYQWHDDEWLKNRAHTNSVNAPMSIYEVHLGSWRRKNGWEWFNYRDLIDSLIPYVQDLGFTHIELMPIAEHPFDGSWGYQVTGYFAPTSRYGTPDDFMAFIDACHQANIGVIVDWVPAHFPKDGHALSFFDGTHLYEHADPMRGEHPDWGTYIFNYGRYEVSQFLISNAIFWADKYHIDGLRVDAVASMLYLDFSRQPGQWVPNQYGGRENLEALALIRQFNQRMHELYPDVLTIAEESTSWPGVTHKLEDRGLGFDLKWNMGWMNDTLKYFGNDPIHRAFHHGALTFSLIYAFSEKFLLPFSHDEVVHLKKSLVDKMPGDYGQKFANTRLLYGFQWSHPGKKLLFMGSEFGQWREWTEERSLDWHLMWDAEPQYRRFHIGLHRFVKALNTLYKSEKAMWADDFSWQGFTWLDVKDAQRSILAYTRIDPASGEKIVVVCNFTPVPRHDYLLGVMDPGTYREILNSDAHDYNGSGLLNEGDLFTAPAAWSEFQQTLKLVLPPLSVIFLKRQPDAVFLGSVGATPESVVEVVSEQTAQTAVDPVAAEPPAEPKPEAKPKKKGKK